jgi:signal transduction histidine kinase
MNKLATEAPRWKTALNMVINPGEAVKSQMSKVPWPYSILVSGLSFTLFFMQTGLDLLRTGQIETAAVILIILLGLLYGTAGIALLAVMSWALSRAGKRGYTVDWAISAFGLGYSATLVYALTGLLFSLAFGWKTAVAFGVTGVLWALRPTLFTIKQMSGERTAFSVALSTLCGAILLLGWALLGRFGV